MKIDYATRGIDYHLNNKSSNHNLSLVSEQHNYATRSASLQHLNPDSQNKYKKILSNYFRMLLLE